MKKDEIEQLLKLRANPSVTIIVPTHRNSPGRIADKDVLRNAINKAKELLTNTADAAIAKALSAKIGELAASIDLLHAPNGIGIYISPETSRIVYFNQPVTGKVLIGKSFNSTELLFELSRMQDYVVLSVSRNKINLYKGDGEKFHHLQNEDFPLDYIETYEYAKTSPGTSYSEDTLKSYEKDKSFLQDVRMKDFMRHADVFLAKYINDSVPVIIAGDTKEIAGFKEVTKHNKHIAGVVTGNYLNDEKQLAMLTHKLLAENIRKQNEKLIAQAKELIGKRMVAIGVEESKRAADEGMGLKLLVERDLTYSNGSNDINDDGHAVDEVIKSVMDKDGKVVIMESGELKDFKGMVMLLRYNNW